MSTLRWISTSQTTKQVNSIVPSNVGIGNSFTITVHGKTQTFVATAGTVANVTAGLVALLNASLDGEFQAIVWTDNVTSILATSSIQGRPFTQTSGATGGTATLVTATTTANSSSEDINTAANYSGGSLPVANDTLFFDDGTTDQSALYSLGSLSAVTLTALNILPGFAGGIGLPEINNNGTPFAEYLATYFAISATTVNVGGLGTGTGAGRIKLNVGSVASTLNVYSTGGALEGDKPAMLWKGTNAANVANIHGGSVGIAFFGGELATVATMRVNGGNVICGAGTTLTTVTLDNTGVLDTSSAMTTCTVIGGTLTHRAGAVTTMTIAGGTVNLLSNGTISTLVVGPGVLDLSGDTSPVTISAATFYPGAVINDPFGRITLSAPASIPGGLNSVTIVRGKSVNLQFS